MKSYLRLFLILVSFEYVFNVAQAEIPEDISQAHKAVWKVEFSNNFISNGTAFFIGPNQVVTNFHVIEEGNYPIEDIYLTQGDKKLELSKVLYISAVDDLVILETKEGVSEYLSMSKEKPSGRLYALGYPQGVKSTWIHSEEYGIFDDDYLYNLLVDHTNAFGLSGGPVLDGQKKVVGVVAQFSDNHLRVIKASQLEELKGGPIGLDCSNLLLSLCIEKEINNLEEQAEQNNALAQYSITWVDKGMQKGLVDKWLLQSARQGYAPAQYQLATRYRNRKGKQDLVEAFKLMSEAAEQGYLPAQVVLGNMYDSGEGVEKDGGKAFDLWLEAAEQGHASAQYNLAFKYPKEEGVDQDEEKAIEWKLKWMLLSANHGNHFAQEHLARMYFYGEGVDKNDKKAFDLWLEAANQGNAIAPNFLDLMYFNGIGGDKDDRTVLDWLLEAANQGKASAQDYLFQIYFNGIRVDKNLELAFKWLLKAAQHTDYALNYLARYNLAIMYLKGTGVDKDEEEAFDWMFIAASQGYAVAQYNLAQMYLQRIGVNKDDDDNDNEAFKWMSKAADQEGYYLAQYKLAQMKLDGIGVDQDKEEAKEEVQEEAEEKTKEETKEKTFE